jgi:leucyl-tRNA synthetase
MSKSKKNTINPEDIIEKYGADAVRLFILSDSPPEKDVQWSDQGMVSSYKFIQKFWILHKKIIYKLSENKKSKEAKQDSLNKFTNILIDKVTKNLEKFHYNVIVANLYETYNFLIKEINKDLNNDDLLENYKSILKVMRPIIPHMTSECLNELNIENQDSWPEVNKEYISDNEVNVVIQINGKKRSVINIQKDLDEKTLINAIKKDVNIKKFLENNNIIRSIYVKNKLINLILK